MLRQVDSIRKLRRDASAIGKLARRHAALRRDADMLGMAAGRAFAAAGALRGGAVPIDPPANIAEAAKTLCREFRLPRWRAGPDSLRNAEAIVELLERSEPQARAQAERAGRDLALAREKFGEDALAAMKATPTVAHGFALALTLAGIAAATDAPDATVERFRLWLLGKNVGDQESTKGFGNVV